LGGGGIVGDLKDRLTKNALHPDTFAIPMWDRVEKFLPRFLGTFVKSKK
jgi:hypothetical protein